MFVDTEASLFLALFSGQSKKTHTCILNHVYKHIKYFGTYPRFNSVQQIMGSRVCLLLESSLMVHPRLPLLLVCNCHFNFRKHGCHYSPYIYLLICSTGVYMENSVRIINLYPHEKGICQLEYSIYIQFPLSFIYSLWSKHFAPKLLRSACFPCPVQHGHIMHL